MATTFLDLIVVVLWPLVLSAAAWVIAINALAETDEISEVVQALIRPNGVEENAKRGDVSLRRSNLRARATAIGNGDRCFGRDHRQRHHQARDAQSQPQAARTTRRSSMTLAHANLSPRRASSAARST